MIWYDHGEDHDIPAAADTTKRRRGLRLVAACDHATS